MKILKKVLCLLLVLILGIQNFHTISLANDKNKEEIFPSGIFYKEMPNIIEDYVKDHEETNAGMSLAIYNKDKTIYENYFGESDKENHIKINKDTVYDWGSASKLFIWISVMQLVEEGKLNLDQDIKKYLPEDFLKNLSYDDKITILDLMNHQAGFQDTYFIQTSNPKEMVSLKEALSNNQPKQVYKPRQYTAYSNWGAALAAFIVENVSKMNYVDYVHENIFRPLNMKNTSIDPIYRDNQWVYERRKNLVSYDINGDKIPGEGMFYIYLYPAGAAGGTIDDFLTFAKAITPNHNKNCILFKNEETLDLLYQATSFYGKSGIANCHHGVFSSYYRVETLGHGGNTFGCSSMIQFDPISGIGMVVMTNQAHELVYNYEMYELLFGKFKVSKLSKIKRDIPQGMLINTRGIKSGPLKILDGAGISAYGEEDLSNWWWQDGNRVYAGYFDFIIDTPKAIFNLISIALLIISGIYSLISLILGTITKFRYKNSVVKQVDIDFLRKSNYKLCLVMLLIFINFILMFLRINTGNMTGNIGHIGSYKVQSVIFGILWIFLAIGIIECLISIRSKNKASSYQKGLSKKNIVKYVFTLIFAVLILIIIIRYDMYKFWAI